MGMLQFESNFPGSTLTPGKIRHYKMWSLGVLITLLMFMSSTSKCQAEAAIKKDSPASSFSISSELIPREPIQIKMIAQPSASKKHTRTRQNSRFLRTFPPAELINLARQSALDNEIEQGMNFYNDRNSYSNPFGSSNSPYLNSNSPFSNSNSQFGNSYSSYGNPNTGYGHFSNNQQYVNPYPTKARIDAGNSPIFYIKLPPVPYVFMPGVGYVSPHPYSSSQNMPMAMSAGSGMMPPGLGSFLSSSPSQETSVEQNNSVISLPLKFLSNGRPHQIESPKRKKHPGNKENSSENKGASLISGGKYSFNGRPTAVFVVRSPARSGSVEKRK